MYQRWHPVDRCPLFLAPEHPGQIGSGHSFVLVLGLAVLLVLVVETNQHLHPELAEGAEPNHHLVLLGCSIQSVHHRRHWWLLQPVRVQERPMQDWLLLGLPVVLEQAEEPATSQYLHQLWHWCCLRH